MVTILKDFTVKKTKKRYYKGDKTNDFTPSSEKKLEAKGFVEIDKKTKVARETKKGVLKTK